MHRHRHLFERVSSFENVLAAARAALRGKRRSRAGAAFFADLEHEVAALHRELRDGSYLHGRYHYSPWIVRSDSRGGRRLPRRAMAGNGRRWVYR